MNQYRSATPLWAITNTIFLFTPIALGIGAFRVWFSPNPAFLVPALLELILYYAVALSICKRTSGAKPWGSHIKTSSGRQKYFGALGLVMFAFSAFHCFYTVVPAFLTSSFGNETTKQLKVASIAAVYRSGCRHEIRFNGVAPALGEGFCVNADQFDKRWAMGSIVSASGRESVLGFRITEFEH